MPNLTDEQLAIVKRLRYLIGDDKQSFEFSDEDVFASFGSNNNRIYLAAAELCDVWAARAKGETDFDDGERSFKDSQKFKNLQTLAKEFRERHANESQPNANSNFPFFGSGSVSIKTTW